MIVLGIDPALRNTGICLLDGPRVVLRDTLRCPAPGGPDEYAGGVGFWWWKWMGLGSAAKTLAAVVIEIPPARVSGRTAQAGTVGHCSGVWRGLAEAVCGGATIRSVAVADWRRVMLGPGKSGADGGSWAKVVAIDALRKAQRPESEWPRNEHEAEAWCLARWWQITRGADPRLPAASER